MIEWRQIEDAPDYWISNRGEILTKRTSNEKIMASHPNKKTGYIQVTLKTNEKGTPTTSKTFYPHILVAEYFVENPDNLSVVHHKNHCKTDNHAVNLEWVSQEQNIWKYYNSSEKNKPRNMRSVEVWTVEGEFKGEYPSINNAAKTLGVPVGTLYSSLTKRSKNPKKWIVKYTK